MTAAVSTRPATGPAVAGAAARLFLERVWLRWLLLVIVFATACGLLGHWQWSRYAGKSQAVHRIEANYDTPAVPLARLLAGPGDPLPATAEWRQVQVEGSYLADRTVLVRNRPYNGVFGYELVTPLRTASGAIFLVDRGWVGNGPTGAQPSGLPQPPEGQVRVTARLRPGEAGSDRRPVRDQVWQIDLGQLAGLIGAGDVYRAYGVLAAESPAPARLPQLLPEPALDLGPHLAYALQWWTFGLGGFVLLGYLAVREVQNRNLRAQGLDPEQVRRSRRRPEPEDEEY